MLFGDDALYYQIIHDAHDPDPAIAWRHRPFASDPARLPHSFDTIALEARFGAGLRALAQRLRPQPIIGGVVCCAPACC